MSKIGIVTYHFVPNYGAAMQAWALQKYLETQGHDVFMVDYRPSHLTTGGNLKLSIDAWSRRSNLVNVYMKVMTLKKAILGDGGKKKKFEEFHSKYFKLSSKSYYNEKELLNGAPEADAYVCGSDQIWNASEQYGIDPVYFLRFAAKEVKKIAYAASFGRPYVHPRFATEVGELIKGVDHIAIREESAVRLVDEVSGRKSLWVPDPTLMVNDGYPEAVAPALAENSYIFSYTLRSRELVASIEDGLRKVTGLEVVSPNTLESSPAGAPGPLEWLGYIKSAKYVVTNSYHGTLFSIIFKKQFVFVGLSGEKAAFNERALSILKKLGLEDRMVLDNAASDLSGILDQPIDWNSVDIAMQEWRETVDKYFEEIL